MDRYPLFMTSAVAVATHILVFRRREFRTATLPLIILALEPLALCATFFSTPAPGFQVDPTLSAICTIYTTFYASLAVSIVAYRISPWHPLAAFPGPLYTRISNLWSVYTTWTGHQHIYYKALHDRYGPFVRVGPNEISIADAAAVVSVLGANGLPKGKYYDARHDPAAPKNLIVLSGEEHANRRRLWNRGMSTASLDNYEALIAARALQLVEEVKKVPGEVDLAAWLSFFSFDFMGDMAFGGGFEIMRGSETDAGLWSLMENFVATISLVSRIPWAARYLEKLPPVSSDIKRLRKFGLDSATARVKSGASIKDLWYHLTDEAGLEKEKPSTGDVIADGALAIIAGADTTATAMSCLFYLLLSNPETYKRLQAEVDTVFPPGTDPLDASKHSSMPFMDACINESLRLLPPVPTNGPRQVPFGSSGRVICDRFVPPGTEVYIPPYVLHRSARYFPAPDAFRPDRWLAGAAPPGAFIPFSFGPANCAGRGLARREMMLVVSLLLQTFDVRFAEGFEAGAWEAGLHDYFVMSIGRLPVVLTERTRGA